MSFQWDARSIESLFPLNLFIDLNSQLIIRLLILILELSNNLILFRKLLMQSVDLWYQVLISLLKLFDSKDLLFNQRLMVFSHLFDLIWSFLILNSFSFLKLLMLFRVISLLLHVIYFCSLLARFHIIFN